MEQVRPIEEPVTQGDIQWAICDYFRIEHGRNVKVGNADTTDHRYGFHVKDTDSGHSWDFLVKTGWSPEEYHEWVEEQVDERVERDGLNRAPNTPDLDNPPYCKVMVDHDGGGEIVKGFARIAHPYPDEEPGRLNVLYEEPNENTRPTNDGSGLHERVLYDARIKSVQFEEKWDIDVRPVED